MSLGLKLYLDCIVFIFGAVVGSFLNVCVHRMPRDQSIVSPPSHCPKCKERIAWWHNIPIVSYILLRGRCRHCGVQISPRYVLLEVMTGALFLAVWWKFTGWVIPIYWIFLGGLIVATFIDFEHFIIPNEITYGGFVVGLICATLYPPLVGMAIWYEGLFWSLVGALTGGFFIYLIIEAGKLMFGRLKVPVPDGTVVVFADGGVQFLEEAAKWDEIFLRASDKIQFEAATLKFLDKSYENVVVRAYEDRLMVGDEKFLWSDAGRVEATTNLLILPQEAMGMGDLKFMVAIGAFLGWKAALFTLMLSSFLGSLVGLALIVCRLRELRSKIPYGPYIAAAAAIWMFYGKEIMAWYMRFLIKE